MKQLNSWLLSGPVLLLILLVSACQPLIVQEDTLVADSSGGEGGIPTELPPSPPALRALARVNGITMYYEIHGEGEPLLLIHGGTAAGAEAWELQIATFAKEFRVIVPDTRGHARSSDTDEPFSYAQMAADFIALLDWLKIDRVHVVGHSDGARIGLYMAIHHPERIGKLVAAGGKFRVDGSTEEDLANTESLSVETYPPPVAERFYLRVSPNPERFPQFLAKIRELWLTQPNYTLEELAQIKAPTLILQGDRDQSIRMEHAQELAAAIPGAQLYIMKGVGHLTPVERPEEFNQIVMDFLQQ